MNLRQSQQDLINEQKALINYIFAICTSFGEFKKPGDGKSKQPIFSPFGNVLVSSASLWFPDGIYKIIECYERNNVHEILDEKLASVLFLIGAIAKSKDSQFHLLQKTFRNRSIETSQFYSIVSFLGDSVDGNNDIKKLITVKNKLETNFSNVEVTNIFEANFDISILPPTMVCSVESIANTMAKYGCYQAIFNGYFMIQEELKNSNKGQLSRMDKSLINEYLQSVLETAEKFNRSKLVHKLKQLILSENTLEKAYARGASAGALFQYFPVEIGAKIGSNLNAKAGFAVGETCKSARQMALSYKEEEFTSLQRTLKQ